MSQIEINYDEAREALSAMYKARYDAFLLAEEIEGQLLNLSEIWEGTDAIAYTEWLSNYTYSVKNTSKWMNDIIYELSEYVNRLESSESDLTSNIEGELQ